MNLQDIEAFVALAETGSINRAALRLHLTQPAVSRRVQNFESALGGAALLDRRSKPSTLTSAGRQALEHCRRILKAVAELEASVNEEGAPAGDLRVGIAHGLGDVVLGTPLDGLRRQLPGVQLHISSDWTRRLVEEVRAGTLDCAIGLVTSEHAVPAGVRVTPLGAESVVVVAAKDASRPASGSALRLRDLAGEGWILNPPGCGCRDALQRAFDRAETPMRVMAEIFGEDLQLSMIVRSAGLGLVPLRQLNQSAHRARLRTIEVQDFALHATIALLHGAALGGLAAAVKQLEARIAARLKELA